MAWATCWQGGGAPPLWPWIQLFRSLGLDIIADEMLGPVGSGDDASRFALFDRCARELGRVGARTPVLAILDDLHWGDTSSLQFLRFAAAGLHSAPLLLVGTARTEPEHDGGEPMIDLRRLATPIDLPGLTRAEVAQLLDRAVEDAVIDGILVRSGGNPLFVKELGSVTDPTGRTGDIPEALQEILDRRFSGIEPDVVRVLAGAALLDATMDVTEIALVTGADKDTMHAVLEKGRTTGILAPSGHACAFSHVLVREALARRNSPDRRREIHELAARVLAGSGAEPAAVARHWKDTDNREETGTWSVAAAETASTRFAHAEAAAHYATAIAAGRDGLDVKLAHAEALLRSGSLVAAKDAFLAVMETARHANDATTFAEAVLGYGAGATSFEVTLFDWRHLDLVGEALASLSSTRHDLALRARLLARGSVAATYLVPAPTRADQAREAVEIARRIDDPSCLAYCISALCDATAGPAHVDDRLALSDEMVGIGRRHGDPEVELLGRRFRLVALLELGRISSARAEIQAFDDMASRLQDTRFTWYPELWRGMLALLDGKHDDALAAADGVSAAQVETESDNAYMLAQTLRTNVLWELGRNGEVLAIFEQVRTSYPGGYIDVVLARAMARAGNSAGARRILAKIVSGVLDEIADDSEYLEYLWTLADAAIAAGAVEHLEPIRTRLEPFAELWAVDGIGGAVFGVVGQVLGEIALASGDNREARRRLERAREIHDGAGAPGPAERSRTMLAALGRGWPHASGDEVRSERFRKNGDVWDLSWDGATTTVRDAKGLHDLHTLVASPGKEFHVLDLVSPDALHEPGTGETIDLAARDAYRTRIRDLQREVEEADLANDLARAERARWEMDAILHELSTATGLGGRPREQGAAAERARKAVSTRIANVLSRIETLHPSLVRHLRASVRTGAFCSYDPERPVDWET